MAGKLLHARKKLFRAWSKTDTIGAYLGASGDFSRVRSDDGRLKCDDARAHNSAKGGVAHTAERSERARQEQ